MIKKIIFKICLIFFFIGTAFGNNTSNTKNDEKLEVKSFGSYIIPDEWVFVEPWSTYNKFFYANEKSKYSNTPTNISIEKRSNPYSIDEHEKFRYAIMKQLSMQLDSSNNTEDTEIGGSGTFTKNNDILYKFTFKSVIEGEECKTSQLYIIGEKQFILIHVTEFESDFRNAEQIAQNIADSFTWSQE